MCAILQHGEIEISNNQVENAIRPIVVGWKNRLFSDTPDGAQTKAKVYTIMETAKVNGLNLEKYISNLPTVPLKCSAKDPKAAVDALLPWAESVQTLCGVVWIIERLPESAGFLFDEAISFLYLILLVIMQKEKTLLMKTIT